VAERCFADGLCLPSGSNLTEADLARVVGVVRAVIEEKGTRIFTDEHGSELER